MNNYNAVQGLLNPSPYYAPYIQQLFPEPYPNGMYNQNEVMMPLGMANSNYQDIQTPAVQEQVAEDPPPPPPEQEPVKPKHKRRSKNEKVGRDYICGCGKDYLSYPALYTHIKTKHGGKNPNGTDQIASSRTRGRPKKAVPSALGKQEEKVNVEAKEAPIGFPFDDILRKYGVLEENKQVNLDALFNNFLSQLKPEEAQGYLELREELKIETPEFIKQSVPVRFAKACTSIFAEYLSEMAHKVNIKFFSAILIFIKLYKDFMNLRGWDIIGQYKAVTAEERNMPFTVICNAEHVPEGSNEFLRGYIQKEYPTFDKEIAFNLTFHLCQWLKLKNYTHTVITPANQIC